MKFVLRRKNKSLLPMEWGAIPDFAVLTGRNGCGKSQLLSVMQQAGKENKLDASLDVGQRPDESVRVLSLDSNFNDLALANEDLDPRTIRQKEQTEWRSFQSKSMTGRGVVLKRIAREVLQRDLDDVTEREFVEKVLPHVGSYSDFFAKRITRRIKAFDDAWVNRTRQRIPEDEIASELGTPPWITFNKFLEDMQVPLMLEDPLLAGPTGFEFRMIHKETSARIKLGEISSGERALVSLACWLFNVDDGKLLPQLLLMDEPDAHLHPAAIGRLIRVLKEVLVEQYGIKVLMTTHRPTTVQFVPEESLFEMRREPTLEIVPSSKASSIAMLTAGFVTVLPTTRTVLVEDADDESFYQGVYNILLHDDQLDSAIPVRFVSAGRSKNGGPTSGGRNEVIKWIGRIQDGPIDQLMFGLIDNDNQPISKAGIYQLDRYSIENYWWDPLVIYHVLALQGCAPDMNGKRIPAQRLAECDQETLQKVADTIIEKCETTFDLTDRTHNERVEVTYCNGITLSYPKWIMQQNGKRAIIENIASAFGGTSVMNPAILRKSFEQLAMIPISLRDILRSIQVGPEERRKEKA